MPRPRSRRQAAVALVVVTVAAAVAVGVLLVSSDAAARVAPWAVGNHLVIQALPVTVCTDTLGAPTVRARLPERLDAIVTPALASSVTVFTDRGGTLDVLAPKGWDCAALEALDGASSLEVFPPGTPMGSSGPLRAVSQGIVASQTGGCEGCSLNLACPLFRPAWLRYESTYRLACHRAPVGQVLRRVASPWAVLFEDPPGVVGAGRPSGGTFAAYGAMAYHEHRRSSTAWLETCALPSIDRVLCVLSVRAFVVLHEGEPRG